MTWQRLQVRQKHNGFWQFEQLGMQEYPEKTKVTQMQQDKPYDENDKIS